MNLLARVADFLDKVLSRITYRVTNLGVIVLMAMVLLVVTDIIRRRAFNSPFPFTLEVVELMLIVVVFFAVAYTASQRSHVSIDLVVSKFPLKAQTILDIVMHIISIGLFSFLCWRMVAHGMYLWRLHWSTGVLEIPRYPLAFVVSFGSALLALVLLARLLKLITEVSRK